MSKDTTIVTHHITGRHNASHVIHLLRYNGDVCLTDILFIHDTYIHICHDRMLFCASTISGEDNDIRL